MNLAGVDSHRGEIIIDTTHPIATSGLATAIVVRRRLTMGMHVGLSGSLLLFMLEAGVAPVYGQSSTVAAHADTGVIVLPTDGERVPRFQDGRALLLKIGPALTGSQELFIAAEEMPPGTAIPLHRHERHEEALFIHRGLVTVTVGQRRVVGEAGTFVYIPAGTWVEVTNTGRQPASVVGIFAKGEVEACFRRLVHRPSPADSVRLERHCAMTFKGSAR
jgi:mannose-6-phosphate isomerase-like protein (cupin superfamily)